MSWYIVDLTSCTWAFNPRWFRWLDIIPSRHNMPAPCTIYISNATQYCILILAWHFIQINTLPYLININVLLYVSYSHNLQIRVKQTNVSSHNTYIVTPQCPIWESCNGISTDLCHVVGAAANATVQVILILPKKLIQTFQFNMIPVSNFLIRVQVCSFVQLYKICIWINKQ